MAELCRSGWLTRGLLTEEQTLQLLFDEGEVQRGLFNHAVLSDIVENNLSEIQLFPVTILHCCVFDLRFILTSFIAFSVGLLSDWWLTGFNVFLSILKGTAKTLFKSCFVPANCSKTLNFLISALWQIQGLLTCFLAASCAGRECCITVLWRLSCVTYKKFSNAIARLFGV